MQDRALIGRLVKREVEATTTWSKFATRVDVSRSTLYRVRDADPVISEGTFRRIERGLSLPSYTFASVGAHDFDVLRAMGLSEELVTWLERQASETLGDAQQAEGTSAEDAPSTPQTPSRRGIEPASEKA